MINSREFCLITIVLLMGFGCRGKPPDSIAPSAAQSASAGRAISERGIETNSAVALDWDAAWRRKEVYGDDSVWRLLFSGNGGGEASHEWDLIRQQNPAITDRPYPLLFLGRLRCGVGERLVAVTVAEVIANAGIEYNLVFYICPVAGNATGQKWVESHFILNTMSLSRLALSGPPENLDPNRIYRGMIDQTDASRFTCVYIAKSGWHHSIEGRLMDDGRTFQATWNLRPEASTAPVAALEVGH